jgi:hypothetical protein
MRNPGSLRGCDGNNLRVCHSGVGHIAGTEAEGIEKKDRPEAFLSRQPVSHAVTRALHILNATAVILGNY